MTVTLKADPDPAHQRPSVILAGIIQRGIRAVAGQTLLSWLRLINMYCLLAGVSSPHVQLERWEGEGREGERRGQVAAERLCLKWNVKSPRSVQDLSIQYSSAEWRAVQVQEKQQPGQSAMPAQRAFMCMMSQTHLGCGMCSLMAPSL